MATITITVGPLTSTLTYPNNTKAQETLLLFYEGMRLGAADATAQEKLDAITNHLALYIRSKARLRYIEKSRGEAVLEAIDLYDLGGTEPTTE